MTDKSVVQSWPRDQLESAFTQREVQLAEKEELRSDEHENFIHQINELQQQLARFKCFKCGDGNTPLYCANCANDQLKQQLAQAQTVNDKQTQLNSELEAKLAQAREDLAKLNTHWTAKGWLSPDEAKRLEAECSEYKRQLAVLGKTRDIGRLMVEIVRLREYAQHKPLCDHVMPFCSCGLNEATQALKGNP